MCASPAPLLDPLPFRSDDGIWLVVLAILLAAAAFCCCLARLGGRRRRRILPDALCESGKPVRTTLRTWSHKQAEQGQRPRKKKRNNVKGEEQKGWNGAEHTSSVSRLAGHGLRPSTVYTSPPCCPRPFAARAASAPPLRCRRAPAARCRRSGSRTCRRRCRCRRRRRR